MDCTDEHSGSIGDKELVIPDNPDNESGIHPPNKTCMWCREVELPYQEFQTESWTDEAANHS
jgi:hypothetical protein